MINVMTLALSFIVAIGGYIYCRELEKGNKDKLVK